VSTRSLQRTTTVAVFRTVLSCVTTGWPNLAPAHLHNAVLWRAQMPNVAGRQVLISLSLLVCATG
jgi:hypothetical protein